MPAATPNRPLTILQLATRADSARLVSHMADMAIRTRLRQLPRTLSQLGGSVSPASGPPGPARLDPRLLLRLGDARRDAFCADSAKAPRTAAARAATCPTSAFAASARRNARRALQPVKIQGWLKWGEPAFRPPPHAGASLDLARGDCTAERGPRAKSVAEGLNSTGVRMAIAKGHPAARGEIDLPAVFGHASFAADGRRSWNAAFERWAAQRGPARQPFRDAASSLNGAPPRATDVAAAERLHLAAKHATG
jgi:hypothetical protein